MEDYLYFLEKVTKFHGHTCSGVALGTRVTLAAMRHLGLDPYEDNKKNLIAFVEVDRCMSDAVMVITGCSPGKRSLKFVDYGRFAATLVNLATGKAVRGTVKKVFSSKGNKEETLKEILNTVDSQLVTLQDVIVEICLSDMPGPPASRATCEKCDERVVDDRHVSKRGHILCRACAYGKYYIEPEEEAW